MLEILEESRIPIDCIVGTSMGSIVGGLYAAGMSPQDLRAAITETDWVSIFRDKPDRQRRYFRRKEDDIDFPVRYKIHFDQGGPRFPLGVLQGQRLSNRLERFEETLGAGSDFDALPIPFRAVATDVETGEPLVIDGGSLAQALRASMSIPGVFRPALIDGRLYVDGGVVANLPVGILRSEFDVDVILAVDISTPLREKEIESYVGVVRRLVRFLTQGNVQRDRARLGPDDLLLVPDLGDLTTAQFERSGEAIEMGREAAEAVAAELARFSVSEEEYRRFLDRQRRSLQPAPVVSDLVVVEAGPVRPAVIEAFVTQPRGAPLDADRLERDLVRLHGLGLHDPIEYSMIERVPEGESVLTVTAPRQRIGLTSMQFGLEIEDDFEGGNSFVLSARHQRLAVNRRGAEWRTDLRVGDTTGVGSEFYQPLDARLRYFVAPGLAFVREEAPVFVDGRPLSLLELTQWGAALDVGRNLGSWGQLRVGLLRAVADFDVAIGLPLPNVDAVDVAVWSASVRFDTLDSPNWPTRGGLGSIQWRRSVDSLGGETEGEVLEAVADWTISAGRTRFAAAVEAGIDLDDATSLGEGFAVGGLFRLSGYGPLELLGNEKVLSRLVTYRQLNRDVFHLLPAGWYAGVSLELGDVFEADESIDASELLFGGALFVGADTPLGPMILGFGYSEPDRQRVYLSFGKSFF